MSNVNGTVAPGIGVSRESARTIAAKEIIARGLGSGVRAIYSPEEVQRAPNIYGGPDLSRCWLAYANDDFDTRALRSSIVVFIDRANGSVLYAGSANDDG
jgi:hypothetical protein